MKSENLLYNFQQLNLLNNFTDLVNFIVINFGSSETDLVRIIERMWVVYCCNTCCKWSLTGLLGILKVKILGWIESMCWNSHLVYWPNKAFCRSKPKFYTKIKVTTGGRCSAYIYTFYFSCSCHTLKLHTRHAIKLSISIDSSFPIKYFKAWKFHQIMTVLTSSTILTLKCLHQ